PTPATRPPRRRAGSPDAPLRARGAVLFPRAGPCEGLRPSGTSRLALPCRRLRTHGARQPSVDAPARPVERAWRRRPRPPPIAEPEEIPMATSRILLTSLALLAGMLLVPHAARAAQSYDTCTGFIDSLPATINSQGTWCLRGNVSTAITSGNAIEVA